jgi:transposase
MPAAVRMRSDFSAGELRRLAATTKNANQSRRLLSLAAILDGMSRTEAARIGGMDRQTLRDWVHRFNERGPDGLKDTWSKGHPPRLSIEQRAELAQVVETGPDRAVHGVVRWRRIDLQRLIAERFGVAYHERTVGKILHQIGFRRISARPRHPAQDERIVAEFKKTSHVRSEPTSPTSRAASRSRSGSRMKPASARRTGSCGNGPDADPVRANRPISATTAPIFSAPFVRPAAREPV